MAENEYFDAEIYTLTDEDGNEGEYEQIGVAEVDGKVYHALIPLDENGEEAGDEYIILRTETDENGEPVYETQQTDKTNTSQLLRTMRSLTALPISSTTSSPKSTTTPKRKMKETEPAANNSPATKKE